MAKKSKTKIVKIEKPNQDFQDSQSKQDVNAEEDAKKIKDISKKSNKKIIFLVLILVLILIIGGCYNLFSSTLRNITDQEDDTPLYQQIQQLTTESDQPLKGENNDRINVLLLGMGGSGHNGGTLTDTIMIASIKPSTGQVALISLPRDLIIKIYENEEKDKGYWEGRKINYTYEIGGMDLAQEKIEEVTGLTINYHVLLDFSGFIKIINDIGGIEINASSRFNGYYHIADVGGTCVGADGGPVYLADGDGPYCIFKFTIGEQTMNGQTSLMYSRIRKVAYSDPDNEYYEGSDFARSKRQQLVLEGFRKKIFATSTLANPIKMTKLLNDLGDHIKTNMQLWEMAKLAKLVENLDKNNIINKVVDESQGLVRGEIATETGAFVLMPTIGDYDFSQIQKFCTKIFQNAAEEKKIKEKKQEVVAEEANIIILNGTTKEGLAAKTQTNLEALDLNIILIGNAPDQNTTLTNETAIFDLTNNNPNTLKTLNTKLSAKKSDQNFNSIYPDHAYDIDSADFIIILGADQYE